MNNQNPTYFILKAKLRFKPFFATTFFAHSVNILAKTARVLNKGEGAILYNVLFEKIKKAFQTKFLEKDGSLYRGFQTAYTLGLAFNLIPVALRLQSANLLAKNVKENNNHLTASFLGIPYLPFALSKNGQLGTTYDLLLQEAYPSWLYPVKMGATTVWERWDVIFPDGSINRGGINDPRDMCSFNHYAYGAIGNWMYKVITGVNYKEEQPGYKVIHIQPQLGEGLSHVNASLESRYGKIRSSWKLENGIFTLNVVIPPNTTATICLPDGSEKISIGSGSYKYTCPLNH
ncbi:MAG: hypothetical protein JW776_11885 [Candidatus Lokiarchaeota archaeon]|nr:hypothetical protein [Candidatus Lokiarchaeota archaeon]